MRVFSVVPFGAAGIFVAATALGAPAPDAALPPLQAAVRSMWTASPEVRAAQAERDAAEARGHAAAQPFYNPSVFIDAENADVDRRTVGLSLALDLSGKRSARAEEGQAALRASEASFERVRRDVASRWLKAWAATALAARQSALGRERVELMRRFDEQAALRLRAGDVSSPERDLAALAFGEALVQQATLVANESAARSTMRALTGAYPTDLPSMPTGAPPDPDSIAAHPTQELPEWREARARLASADAGIQVARRARIPDPTVSLTGGRVRSGPFDDRVIGISVSVPLMWRNTGRADVDAASATADAAAAAVQARGFSLQAAQEETRSRYEALREAIVAFGQGRAGAFEERAAVLEKLWRAGEISTSDYLVQLKQSVDTALSALELQSQAWQAWFDCLAAAGRLNDWVDGLSANGDA